MTFTSMPDLLEDVVWEEEIGNSLVVREPVGVVGAITPWNYPLHQIAAKVAPALAVGCTVVLKPSEVAPLNAFILAEIIDEVGLPAGVFNLVTGTGPVVGEAIASHPGVDMVSFTGSTRAGRRVSELAAQTVKPVALELGGKSPNVILDDADLETAVTDGVAKCFLNSGQTCSALTRMLVPRERLEEAEQIAAAVAERVHGRRPVRGGHAARAARLGRPARARARLHPQGRRGGREARDRRRRAARGPRPRLLRAADGVLRRAHDMTIAQEEIFGPVLSIIPYDDEEDAVRIANDSHYGLAGGVWSADEERAKRVARRIRTGQVEINGGVFNPLAPFGGYKQSGHGRELGRLRPRGVPPGEVDAALSQLLLERLEVEPEELQRRTGWEIRPEGACKGDLCVPLPDAAATPRRADARGPSRDGARARRPSTASGRSGRSPAPAAGRCSRQSCPTSRCPTATARTSRCARCAARRSSCSPGRRGEGAASTCPCGRKSVASYIRRASRSSRSRSTPVVPRPRDRSSTWPSPSTRR